MLTEERQRDIARLVMIERAVVGAVRDLGIDGQTGFTYLTKDGPCQSGSWRSHGCRRSG